MAAERSLRIALIVLLEALAGYGVLSMPGLAAAWGPSIGGLVVLALWAGVAGWVLAGSIHTAPRWQWGVFWLVALGFRVAAALLTDGRVSPGDPHWYLVLAENLLHGRGLTLFEPFMGVEAHALFPPAYALLLAGWGGLVGFTTGTLLLLSTLTDLAAAAVIVQLGRSLATPRAGIAAASLYLIWPSVVFDAPLAQKESFATLLALLLAWGWVRADRERAFWRSWLAIGVPAGLLALTQPGQAPLAGLFAIALLPRLGLRRMLAVGVPAAGVAAAVMVPWWVRNWRVFGQFVPLTSAGGYSLWIGNNPDATGSWEPPPAALRGLPEIAFGKAAAAIAKQWIVTHPLDFVHLTIAKFLRACAVSDFLVDRLAAMRPPIARSVGALLFPLSYGAHLLLLGGGAAALGLRRTAGLPTTLLLLAACIAQLALFGVWFEFSERHRAFLTPFLLLAVAQAVAGLRAGVSRIIPSAAPLAAARPAA
ncbi:glycosyltransferase family 39 protein [Sphingomonas aracearum]|uniref:Glycosyltransferase n=1 Tax=Sphingomonas aracearum TaxID=2283317 RepID=A0A369VSX6_9SPHN|nr:glycosyltransferase family 39 protein [Sphingomonas aracearum]RDE04775.1 glycosyltransferase [Sphingomonas aracearum]